MSKNPDLADVFNKLHQIDEKLDRVRGDVNVLATLHKEKDQEHLAASFRRKIGFGLKRQRLWYFAEQPRTIDDLARIAGITPQSAQVTLWDLNDRGLLVRRESETGRVVYSRAEVFEGIGVDKWIEENHEARGIPLGGGRAEIPGKSTNGA